MGTLRLVRSAFLAGLATAPSVAQAQQPIPDVSEIFGIPQVRTPYCIYQPTDPKSGLLTAIAITKPIRLFDKPFDNGDVIYDFGRGAEFLVRGKVTENLPGTRGIDAVAHLNGLLALIPQAPGLVASCTEAQNKKNTP